MMEQKENRMLCLSLCGDDGGIQIAILAHLVDEILGLGAELPLKCRNENAPLLKAWRRPT